MSKQYAFELEKEFTFEAAHMLPDHDGKCARLHGHSWKGRVCVASDHVIVGSHKDGMVMDYSDLKKILAPMVEEYLDHHYLNHTLPIWPTTSENVARFVFNYIKPQLPGNVELLYVEIDETCTSRCRYYGKPSH